MNVNDLIKEVESLPLDIKTELIERLLESVNPSYKEIDEAWAIEAEARLQEIKNGTVKTIPGDKVFKEIRNKFSR